MPGNITCATLLFCWGSFLQAVALPFSPDTFALSHSPSGTVIINSISITGNKVTKPYILLRELNFSKGDTLDAALLPEKIQKSRENLLNTSLFNFVNVDIAYLDSSRINIIINVTERWYTWPVPIFEIAERNFNTWWLTKDLSRANYGFYLTRDNFRGRKESFSLKFRFGYSEQFGFSYHVPYLNKKQHSGLGVSFYYNRNHEIAYATRNNQLQYYKDEENYVREELTSKISYTNRQGFYNTHLAEIKYFKGSVADTVLKLTRDYFINNQPHMEFFTLYYIFRRDYRDSKVYPLKGYYFDFSITKHGIGILKNENLDVLFLEALARKYWKIGPRLYLASSIRGKFSPTYEQPYYVQRALGYRDYVRAYEYYVVDGQNFVLFKTSLRYELIRPRIQKIPYLKTEKFNTFHYALYAGLFSDAGYVEDRINNRYNSMSNTLLFGTGAGLDFVTYYDNVVRMEYSVNKLGEYGFFLHFSSAL